MKNIFASSIDVYINKEYLRRSTDHVEENVRLISFDEFKNEISKEFSNKFSFINLAEDKYSENIDSIYVAEDHLGQFFVTYGMNKKFRMVIANIQAEDNDLAIAKQKAINDYVVVMDKRG